MNTTTRSPSTVSRRISTRRLLSEVGLAALSGTLALMGFVRISGVRWSDLGSLWSSSDGVVEYAMAKVQGTGSLSLFEPNLGYPNGQDWSHFPVLDTVNRLELAVLNLFFDPVTAVNVLYVLSFPLIAIVMYGVLRNFHVMRILAVFGGVSLSLIGYHFDYEHPFLGNYWLVPVGVVWLAIVSNADSVLSRRLTSRQYVGVGLAIALVVGLQNPQYVVFFSLIGLVGAAVADKRTPRALRLRTRMFILAVPGIVLLTTLALGRVLRQVPAVTSSTDRPVVDSYVWAGKFFSLLTVPGESLLSGLPFNTRLLQAQETTDWTGVSAVMSAPIAASMVVVIGAALILVSGFHVRSPSWTAAVAGVRPWAVSWLTAAAFFVTGGMGVVFAALVYPQVRGWARISVILAAVALTATLILASAVLRLMKVRRTAASTALTLAISVFMSILFLDQFTAKYPIQVDSKTLPALNDLLDSSSPDVAGGCPVLNLPLMYFPEAIPAGSMNSYDHLLPYLVSSQERFSYGAVRGQLGSRWTDHLPTRPEALALRAAEEGFCALLVDSNGLDENSPSLEQFEQSLGPAAATALGRWFLFDLPNVERVDSKLSLFSKPEVDYGSGLTPPTLAEDGSESRWTKGASSRLRIWNPGTIQMEWIARTTATAAKCPNGQRVRVATSGGFALDFTLDPRESKEILIPLRIPARDNVDLVMDTPSPGCPNAEQPSDVGVQIRDLRFQDVNQPGVEIVESIGFHPEESAPSGDVWQWIDGSTAQLKLMSTSNRPTSVILTGEVQSPLCEPSQDVLVEIDGQNSQSLTTTVDATTPLLLPLNFGPYGEVQVTFTTSTQGCRVLGDDRLLGPKVQDITLVSVEK